MAATEMPPTTAASAVSPGDARSDGALEALRSLAAERLGALFGQMLDGTDDLLFDLAARAANNIEVRGYFDTMRVVRLQRAVLLERFLRGVEASFSASTPASPLLDEISIDSLALVDTRHVEETIALANLEARVEGLYRQPLWELRRRLETLRAGEALSPASICRALQAAMADLDIDFEVELVIYKLFDRLVVGGLGGVYTEAVAVLDQHGVRPAPRSVRAVGATLAPAGTQPSTNAADAGQVPGAGGEANAGSAASVGGTGPLDPHTLAVLQRLMALGGAAPGAVHAVGAPQGIPSADAPQAAPALLSDAALAGNLALAAGGQPVAGWNPVQAAAYAQRAGLVGRLFNGLGDDPYLPESIKPELEGLRFGLIKSALADARFFADTEHPLRRLIDDLATTAATAKTAGAAGIDRVAGLVRALRAQIDAAAAAPNAAATPLTDDLAAQFLDQQQQQSRTRRKAIIAKVRETVAAELRLRAAGQDIPEAAQPLLAGWSTMMAYHLIRENTGGWGEGIGLLLRLLQALDPQRGAARTTAERAELRLDATDALTDVGIAAERVDAMLTEFDASLDGLDAPSAMPALTPPVDAQQERIAAMLELLLVNGRWFHVQDPSRNERRWLKLIRSGPEGAVFCEYHGRDPLSFSAEATYAALLDRSIEPIDAPPAARQMLDALILREERAG